jgi:hypothetical protein
MLSAWLMSVPQVEYRSVRQSGVPSMNSSTVVAFGLKASILPQRVLNSARVMSLVQQLAVAGVPVAGSAGVKGTEHFAASSGIARIFVVVCRSHCEWRHTSWRSFVKVTSPRARRQVRVRVESCAWRPLRCDLFADVERRVNADVCGVRPDARSLRRTSYVLVTGALIVCDR